MKKLVSTFVKYPFYANLAIAVFLIAGLISILNLKLSFFPERPSKDLFVTMAYPGASPKEMEEGVTIRVEEALRSIVGIKEISSTSSENFTTINVKIFSEYDVDDVLLEVKNAVDGIVSFPRDAEKPIVYKQRPRSMAGFMALSGDVDLITLKLLSDEIENDFLNSGVLSQVTVQGVPELEISIETKEETLLRYGLTFNDVSNAIAQNNIDLSGGLIRSDKEEILIRTRNRTVDPDLIGEIILRASQNGDLIKIRDVAEINLQFAEGPGKSFMNGKPSISFNINKLPEEDLGEINAYITEYAKTFNEKHPSVDLVVTYSFIKNLKARLSLLMKNGGIGLLLVVIALGFFMNFRLAAWVAWGIPASFLAMFVMANMYGITINMISLFGMILVIGILVDDGIVIGENIFSHFEKGKSPKRAAIDGAMEVIPAVVTSIATTIIAFTPLFFVEGMMSMMHDVAFVVVFSLAFSLVEAFLVLPAHLGHKWVLREDRRELKKGSFRFKVEKGISYVKLKVYGRFLHFVLKNRVIFMTIPIALVLITIGLFKGGLIKMTFFPSIPFDQFNVDIAFKPGTGEKVTEEYLIRFEEAIWEVNEDLKEDFNDTIDYVDYTFRGVGNSFSGQQIESHAGNIMVMLRDLENTGITSFEVVNRVKEQIGEVPEAEKFTVAGRNTFGDPISISLLSNNNEELEAAKEFLKEKISEIDAVNNVNDNNVIGKQEVRIKLKPKAYVLGLNYATISNQIRLGFFGGQAQRLQSGRNELRVWVRYPQDDRLTLGQLEKVKIKTPQGEYPLGELVDYTIDRGPVSINRYNGSRVINITAGVKDPKEPTVPINAMIKDEFVPEMLAQFPTVSVEYLGQQKESKDSGASLGKSYGVAFLLILLIIMIHFKSFSQMLIIIAMIPLGILGALWGHGIEGIPVSMLSVWGIVALTGVIVNDAVVFLQKFNSLVKEGIKVKEAVHQAGIARFRAIILTTITTTVGLYPIILERSFQAQFLVPLAVSLAYGVFIGTLFILIFFPAMILLLNDFKVWLKYMWTGTKPSRENVTKAFKHDSINID
ncbi:MAG: efflux RND transporter permease subunit [Cytophagia bacterium]|nr:efflux RND transporter permease subunit [Cytophagia bacterium]